MRSAAPYPGMRRDLRARLLQKPSSLSDADMLRLILARAIPRDDPGPLAERLMERFGRFSAVINASSADLQQVRGVSTGVVAEISLAAATSRRMALSEVMGRPVIASWTALLSYVRVNLAGRPIELFGAMFLDRRNQLIADEVMNQGTVDHAPVYPREIVRRALELSASAVILYHNHPSGEPTPSKADVEVTHRIIEAARPLGIQIHDHVIVGANDVACFKSLGLM